MSEQGKILDDLEKLIMDILKTGSASPEQEVKLDRLEDLLYKQKSFQKGEDNNFSCKGEEIASLLFANNSQGAVEKLYQYKITPEDFFGFAQYHYDEGEEEVLVEDMFTGKFQSDIKRDFAVYKNSL